MDLELLIHEVREQQLLWDKKHKNYRNRLLTKRAWKHVAASVGCSSEEAQSKWKNLRDSFCRELKKIKKPGTDEEELEYTGEWLHFEAMKFLKGSIRPRKNNSTARKTEEADYMDDEDIVSVKSVSTEHSSNTDNPTYLQCDFDNFPVQYESVENAEPTDGISYRDVLMSNTSTPVESKNVKQTDFVEMLADLERKKFDLLKKEIEYDEDEDMNWFKSILPHLRTLPPLNKFLFRTKVQEMLLIELTKLNSPPAGSSTERKTICTSYDQ